MRRRALVASSITILLWSSAFVGIRVGLTAFSAFHLVLLRFLTASMVLLGGVVVTRGRLIPPKQVLLRVFIAGITGFTIYHTALTLGERTVGANTASFIIAGSPIFSTLLARLFLKERIRTWGWVGLCVSFSGVLVMTGIGHDFHKNSLLILLSAVSTSFYFVIEKPLLEKYRALDVTAWVTFAGTIPMLFYGWGMWRAVTEAPLYPLLMVIYIGVFPAAVAYVTWSMALRDASMNQVAPMLYLTPVLASILGWILLGERPGLVLLFGGGLVILGVWLIQHRGVDPVGETSVAMRKVGEM